MQRIKKNAEAVEKQVAQSLIKANRQKSEVQIIVVTKSVSVDDTQAIAALGYHHLAENRPEGLQLKQEAVTDPAIVWHYIGSLQTRKVKQVINKIDYLHSLDRWSLAKEIEKRADHVIRCFLQVNVTGEESKSGLRPEETEQFLSDLQSFNNIEVIGLMTMAPKEADEEALHKTFRSLKQLQETLKQKAFSNAPCTELSMGMSQDYPIAIEEGATFVRIGTAFFEE
ncbi:YggS family pyridoxal phosphate-dependent enzyme [Pisciglobus halotolerans]|uniref:Pyridoxal phosphate homeostasis protein n=1 Tax=Pisciglobus halotolerans TaxID=745365 RepID=A0A1I3BWD9_9LACT|nr:YggS family pyridoxal phosphate-dependent enzyme [Pisciglobus halotolerans]SFH66543.1 hypothetical protein SAMN04489868_11040 [Pisciglobus halotolerans]